MNIDRLICMIIGHDDEEFGDVEAPYPNATYKYCHRCEREDPPPW